jgi:hypothetical protein
MTRMTRAPAGRMLSKFCQRHAGGDGNEQMIFCERSGNFGECGGNLVGLGRQNQDVGKFGDLGVGRGGFRADFGGKMFRAVSKGSLAMISRGTTISARTKPFGERGGHFARAEKADIQLVAMLFCNKTPGGAKSENSRLEFARATPILVKRVFQ